MAVARQALAVCNSLLAPEDRIALHIKLANYFEKAGQVEDVARHERAGLVFGVVTGYQTHLWGCRRNLGIRIRLASRSGQARDQLPRLADLLARPEFDALARFLTQRGIDREPLQATIDGLVERTRQQALGPAAPAQGEAQALRLRPPSNCSSDSPRPPPPARTAPRSWTNSGSNGCRPTPTRSEQIDALLADLRAQLAAAHPSGDTAGEPSPGTDPGPDAPGTSQA